MKNGSRYTLWVFLSGLLFLGCEDSFIDPFENDGRYYTIYGYLDQAKNFEPGATHAFRVIPVTRRPAVIESLSSLQADIDGRVFITNTLTGVRSEMLHSLEELTPGKFGHIFDVRLFVRPGHTYRIDIERSDGIVAYAETRVPSISSIQVQQQAPIVQDGDIVQPIILEGAKSIWDIEVIYHVGGTNCFTSTRMIKPYKRAGTASESGWAIPLKVSSDLRDLNAGTESPNVALCAMGIQARILDDQWVLPEGELDLDEIALPEQLTNVVNGYGFVGSVGFFQADWPLAPELNEVVN